METDIRHVRFVSRNGAEGFEGADIPHTDGVVCGTSGDLIARGIGINM